MKTRFLSFFSTLSSRDRLFWFSRAGRLLFLAYFTYAAYSLIISQNTLVHWLGSHFRTHGGPPFPIDSLSTLGGIVLNTVSSLLLCWWYWLVARLFKTCESGQVFSDSSVHLLGKIAKLFLFFAVVGFVNQILFQWILGPYPPDISGSDLNEFFSTNVTYIGFGMFGLQFNGIDLEPIAVALMIFIALGVVEEGRKVQDEQKLTV